ncbi:hypothetical protein FRC09_010396 [Ceratobasidium sp. 395]|nr:hypothetical protein FRC09_010396 [Ceratobasidium sp. 395]
MAEAFLPNSSKAVPATNEERTTAVEPPKVSWTAVVEDSSDLPGEEMTKDAQVWRTYVREADRWDKEMIDGRNSFVIESLGDLKSDPADSTAQTLLLMSQTLTAIANGQPAPPLMGETSGSKEFSPSRSAVAVNVLWLLSLSLSVAVSLVAMLAKDWCYKFMSGRSGQIYEQARRRQEKWEGMQRWKMNELLECLPMAMHLALLLFAAGLCVYLWDINIGVAVPVVVITGLAWMLYGFATVLPLFDRFCPYSTPVVTPSKIALSSLKKVLPPVKHLAHPIVRQLYLRTSSPNWLVSAFGRMLARFEPHETSYDTTPEINRDNRTMMDRTASQMIAWLITNCEDSRSVDIALQAIAGAHADLPHAALAQCNAINLAVSRFRTFAQSTLASDKVSKDDLPRLYNTLQYGRACVVLLSGDSYAEGRSRWALPRSDDLSDGPISTGSEGYIVYSTYINVWKLTLQQRDRAKLSDIIIAAAAMPFCHWTEGIDEPDFATLDTAAGTLASTLEELLQGTDTLITSSILYTVVESLAHYMVARWPREDDHEQTYLIPILLSRVFIISYNTTPDVACATAITLAVAAFASYAYPGGEEPTSDVDAREKRAVSVLRYYQRKQPDDTEVLSLFVFGFFSWLPQMISSGCFTHLEGFNRRLNSIMDDTSQAHDWSTTTSIWTLPDAFSLPKHKIDSMYACQQATISMDTHEKTDLISASCLLWFRRESFIGAYLIALISLCRTESKEHQKLCLQVIATQYMPNTSSLQELNSIDDKHLLQQLCHTLLSTNASAIPFAAVHFGLLVVNIMVGDDGSLEERKSALRPLLSLRDQCSGLKEPKPFAPSDMVSYLEQKVENGPTADTLLQVMQYVVDFCDCSPDDHQFVELDTSHMNRLWELKYNHQFSLGELESLLAKTQRSPAQEERVERLTIASNAYQDSRQPVIASPESA